MKVNAWRSVNKITKGGVRQSLRVRTGTAVGFRLAPLRALSCRHPIRRYSHCASLDRNRPAYCTSSVTLAVCVMPPPVAVTRI
jgi:hypothetical protein